MSNLAVRVLVAIVGIPLVLAACYLGGAYFFLFTTGVIVISTNEFYSLAHTKNIEPASVLGITAAGVMNAMVYSTGLSASFDFLAAIVVITLLYELARKRTDGVTGTFANIGTTITGIVYIGVFGSLLTAIRERMGIERALSGDREAGLFLASILVTIWICDSAAYFVGRSIGKHKMSKFVSPNKSWEGAIAGFIFALAAAIVLRIVLLPELGMKFALGMGLIVGVFGQAGDFVESLFKRDAGAKDSSTIIPGHGGVFDRFDSLLFSAPLIYLLLKHVR